MVPAVYFEVEAALVADLQMVRQLLLFGLVPLPFGMLPPAPPSPAAARTPDEQA